MHTLAADERARERGNEWHSHNRRGIKRSTRKVTYLPSDWSIRLHERTELPLVEKENRDSRAAQHDIFNQHPGERVRLSLSSPYYLAINARLGIPLFTRITH